MSERLMIKSIVCANSNGVFVDEEKTVDGEKVMTRKKVQEPFDIPENAKWSINQGSKKITITIDGKERELPIDDYSLSLRA